MSLSRPQSRASSGGRGPPPTPPPTYLWEEVRRQRSRGGYPWTILDKEPLQNSVDVELLLKGEISGAALNASLPDEYCTESLQRRRISRRDRFNQGRARSEPTPSIPSSSSRTDMASLPPEEEEVEVDDFPLNDEEIPDFVMEYLQSDEGNLEDNIPDHILEYIQSRAAALQKREEVEDDIVYTEEELRIIEDTRRKMEESGELPKAAVEVNTAQPELVAEPELREEDEDFDVFFQQALATHNPAKAAEVPSLHETGTPGTEEKGAKPKKGGKFKLRSISLPPKPQINLRLPKSLKLTKDSPAESKEEEAADKKKEKKEKKEKRKQSPSPIRQRINEQFQSWNNSLKKFKPLARKTKREDDVKGFIALLPGVSSGKTKEQEHQYEEVRAPPVRDFPDADEVLDLRERFPEQPAQLAAAPVVTITTPDDLEEALEKDDSLEKAGEEVTNPEETMEDVENLPESEIADIEENQVVPEQIEDVEQIEEIPEIEEEIGVLEMNEAHFLDEEQNEEIEEEQVPESPVPAVEDVPGPEEVPQQKSKASVLASRGLKALEATKSTIQRKLSRENLQATRNKLHATFTGTLKKRAKNKEKSSTLPRASEQQNIFDSSTTPRGKNKNFETSTPIEITAPRRNRVKKKIDTVEYPTATRRKHKKQPRMETVPSAEEQDPEQEPENPANEEGSDKENIIRPNPRRNKNRRPEKRYGFHEDFIRPQSAYYSSEIRNSWNDYPHLSQEIHEAFCAPVNSLEAVDGSTGELSMKRPQRPLRSRKKNRFSTLSEADIDYHDYCNVPYPNPRRLRKNQHPTDRFTTWPKKIEQPAAPKRLKRGKTAPRDNFQTWPRKCQAPVAPRRCRSKTGSTFLSQEESLNDFNINQAHYDVPNSHPVYNILHTEVPETVLKFEGEKIGPETSEIAFADENGEVQEQRIPEEVEIVVPKAPMRKIKSRTNSLRREKNNQRKFDDATWPRVKKSDDLDILPVAPGRNKRQSKFLEQPAQGTAAPSVTPNEYEPKISNDQALQELDQLLETLATTQQQSAPAAEVAAPVEDPYSEIKAPRKSPPPRPPPPVYASQSTASYSYIYTVPRRNPRTYHEISPERSLRDYCTIRPHRPPRRSRPHTELYEDAANQQQTETGRRHSISNAGDVKQQENKETCEHLDGDIHAEELRERKLQDSSVIEKMRARPLPAPPRTKRIRSHSPPQKPPRRESSLRRKGSLRAAGSQQQKAATPKPIHIDGYEPVCPEPIPCEPTKVQEVSIAIQTDPLPEYEDDFMESTLADAAQDQGQDHSPSDVMDNYQENTQEGTSPKMETERGIPEPEEEKVEDSVIPEEFAALKSPEGPEDDSKSQDVKDSSRDPVKDSGVTQEESGITSEIPEDFKQLKTAKNHENGTETENVEESTEDPKSTKESGKKTEESGTTSEIPEDLKKLKAPKDRQDSSKPGEPKSTKDPAKPASSTEVDDEDSFSRVPPNFPLPLPQLRVEFPSRLQLAELEVERLNVRDLQAQRIVVSNIDTQTLQVSEITSSSGPVVLISAPSHLSTTSALEPPQQAEDIKKEDHKSQLKEEEKRIDKPKEEEKKQSVETSDASQQCDFNSSAACTIQTEPEKGQQREVPVSGNVPEAVIRIEEREPTVGELTLQLVGVSTRQLGRAAGVAVERTWQLAQQVARLGWQRIDEQLRARGIHLSKQEQENAQVIVILIMIIIAGILLLGMGRRGLGHRWEIYYPY